jgi:Ca2+-binding RTX toxin-like protein
MADAGSFVGSIMEATQRAPSGRRTRAIVVQSYGDSAQGMFVTSKLLACGYTVMPAHDSAIAVLARAVSSYPDLPVAHIGAAHDVRALASAASRLQRRVTAMVTIGGPLGLLLDQFDGLEVPTLVVADGANRALRRRARRALPRGSRVVRASDFDAALRAAVEFLDLRTSVDAGAPAVRPAPKLSSRLAPAALLAAPAALFVTASAANAAATCTDAIDGDTLFITCEGDGEVALEIGVSADGQILMDRQAKVSVSDIKVIKVVSTASNTLMLVNEQGSKLGTGIGTPEDPFVPVQLDVKLDGGQDTLAWLATEGIDQFKLLGEGYDVTGDGVVDHKVLGAETLKFDLLAGNDLLDGGDWLSKILVDGGAGDDVLIGGLGDDSFKLSLGKDALDGAGGFDEIKLVTDDSQVKLTDTLVSLADAGSESSYKQFEALTYLGGDAANKVELAGIKLQKVDLDGGGGLDELKLTRDDSLVTIGDGSIKLLDAAQEISFKQFSTLSYLGGKLDSKVELAGDKLQKVDLDLGDGVDLLSLTTDDSSVKLSDSLIELGDGLSSFKYSGVDSLSYLGGKLDSKVELAGIKLQKVDLDGGGGLDLLSVTSDASLFKITDTGLVLGIDTIGQKAFESLEAFGGDSANKIDGSQVTGLKLTLDGGGGNDVLLGGALSDVLYGKLGSDVLGGGLGDDKLGGGVGNDQLSGGGGIDTVFDEADVSFTATSTSLSGLGSDVLASIESLYLVGGAHDNVFDASRFKLGGVTLDGGAGDDVLLGSPFADKLLGSLGDDRLTGNQGNDSLYADVGDDYLDGSQGTDLGDGGPGSDTGKSIEIRFNLEK